MYKSRAFDWPMIMVISFDTLIATRNVGGRGGGFDAISYTRPAVVSTCENGSGGRYGVGSSRNVKP